MNCQSVSTITEFLQWMVTHMRAGREDKPYSCFEDFVLKHGREFTRIGKVPKRHRGRMKECYKNAAHLALMHEELTYCEGYAHSILPVMHAWCVTKRGTVIDPTWPDGTAYYGVPFKRRYLTRCLARNQVYGILDCPPDFPTLTEHKPEDFLAKL